jgi:hypothetical protein
MAKGARCDWEACGKFMEADAGPSGWLALEVGENWTTGTVSYDFCCVAHLREWAIQRTTPAHQGKP